MHFSSYFNFAAVKFLGCAGLAGCITNRIKNGRANVTSVQRRHTMHKKNNRKSEINHTHTNGSSPAGPKSIEVVLALEHPEAREVYLAGDFNHWSPDSLPMI